MKTGVMVFIGVGILLDLLILAIAGRYLYALWRRFRGLGEEE